MKQETQECCAALQAEALLLAAQEKAARDRAVADELSALVASDEFTAVSAALDKYSAHASSVVRRACDVVSKRRDTMIEDTRARLCEACVRRVRGVCGRARGVRVSRACRARPACVCAWVCVARAHLAGRRPEAIYKPHDHDAPHLARRRRRGRLR